MSSLVLQLLPGLGNLVLTDLLEGKLLLRFIGLLRLIVNALRLDGGIFLLQLLSLLSLFLPEAFLFSLLGQYLGVHKVVLLLQVLGNLVVTAYLSTQQKRHD